MFLVHSKRLALLALLVCAAALSAPAFAEWGLNLPLGITPLSKEIYWLHMLIFGVCCVIAVVVFGAMIYSMRAAARCTVSGSTSGMPRREATACATCSPRLAAWREMVTIMATSIVAVSCAASHPRWRKADRWQPG